MAESSGSGGLGALTLGGIAGTAVVLGGVVLFQLGIFGSGSQDGSIADGSQPGSQTTANDGGEFTGDGDESGQPLQNSEAAQTEAADTDTVAAEAALEPLEESAVAAAGEASLGDAVAGDSAVSETETAEKQPAAPAGEIETAAVDAVEEPPVTVDSENEDLPPDEAVAGELGADAAEADGAVDETVETPLVTPNVAETKEDIFVLEAPELDLVRVDNEGAAVIAGRAQAGVQVSILLDGEVLEQMEVPAGGEFVSLATIAPSADARVVSLLAEHEGQQSASGASFILAPVSPVAAAPQEDAEQTAEAEAVVDQPAQEEEQVAALDTGSQAELEQPLAVDQQASQEVETASAGAETGNAEPVQELAEDAEPVSAEEDPESAAEPAAPQPQNQAVAVLRADADGIEVVQPALSADPELNDEIALDSISYNGTGGVELSGRAQPDSRVRVYIDNAPVAEIETAGDGRWNGRLEGVEPGVYTLRLDEIERSSDTVVSRLETPFKREAPEVLVQPDGDNAPDQPAPLVRAVTVQKGDTLWAISQQKYGSGFLYVRLFEANSGAIRNPDLIYPGQVFTIPE